MAVILNKIGVFLLVLFGASMLTLLSAYYVRPSSELLSFGDHCGIDTWMQCYRSRLSAGFPFAFVFDSPNTSVVGHVSIGTDETRLLPFIVNVWFYTLLILFSFKISEEVEL